MASTQDYFQLNKRAHPTYKSMAAAFEELTDEERMEINVLRRQLPEIGEEMTGHRITQIGPQGFLELLCRIALLERAYEIGEKTDLGRMDVIKRVMKSIR